MKRETLQPMRWKSHNLSFDRTLIMGVLNVTPDSFSDGGKFFDSTIAAQHALRMAEEGADIIDIGGESTRPGSDAVTEEEELRRVLPVIKLLAGKIKIPLSIDTMNPAVADACLSAGASILNNITGLQNEDMIAAAAKHNVPVVLMHMQGTPKTMQSNPQYGDVVGDIKAFFKKQITHAQGKGVRQFILDPGIGFGKTTNQNLALIKRLQEFTELGHPLLIGPSRKSFIGSITGLPAEERLEGTLAAVAISILNGANIVRVHDVRQAKRAALIADAVRRA